MNVQRGGCESRMTKKICLVEGCRECPFFKKGKQYAETPVKIDYYHHCLKSGAYHADIDGLFKTCILPNHRENDLNYVRVSKPIITYDPPDESKHPPKTINWGG